MPLRHAADLAAAEWVSALSLRELSAFGPSGFEAYARLRYVPDPAWAGQSENDLDVPEGHPSELDLARRTLGRLAHFTGTGDHCYFAVWDGYGELELLNSPGTPVVLDLPHRRYWLMEGPLDALATWELDLGRDGPHVPPALVWPADHSWCFVSDVDPHWAGIGASAAAIGHLLADPSLDIVLADPREAQPYYS